MKKENGVTLISLVIYVIAMIILLAIMSVITTEFYSNTRSLQGNVQEIIEFNKFNNYFLKEVKTTNNKVENFESNKYILFASGNSFSLLNNSIYYNDKKICDEVQNIAFSLGKNGDTQDETIINVTLNFKNFNKSISYKIENIY